MPCVVPTCGTTEGTFRLFPQHGALSERWQEAILVGCGIAMDAKEGDELASSEICQLHFTGQQEQKEGTLLQYQEPFFFRSCDGSFCEVASCRMCLGFFRSIDMVPSSGVLGDSPIKFSVYQTMSIRLLETDFLELVCQGCVTRIELLNSIVSYFSLSEDAFQVLAKLAKESENQIHSLVQLEHPPLDTFIEEERAESTPEPEPVDDIIMEGGSSSDEWEPAFSLIAELPKRILRKRKREEEEEEKDIVSEIPEEKPAEDDSPEEQAPKSRLMARKCYICVLEFADGNELMLHLVEQHAKKTNYRCELCSVKFGHIAAYNRHLSRHESSERPLQCGSCPLRFRSLKHMKQHENKIHGADHPITPVIQEPPEEGSTCWICGKSFVSKFRLTLHVQTVHKQMENIPTCKLCDKTFTAKSSLERHMLLHSNEKPHTCDECGENFRRLLLLRNHIEMVHRGNNPHVCSECGQDFRNYHALYQHKQTIHLNKPLSIPQSRIYHLLCALCKKHCKKAADLTAHIQDDHAGEEYPYVKCPDCPRTFLTRHQLAHHKEIHTDKYACHVCGHRNATIQRLQAHIENKHSEVRKYDCPICITKSYKTSAALRRHVQLHSGEKAFECEYCKKTFTRKDQMLIHVRIHTGEKPFQCPICLKRFSDDGTFCKHKKRCQNIVLDSHDEDSIDLLDDNF